MSADAPKVWPDGTSPGNRRLFAELIGQRCDVVFTDTTGTLPQYVQRVGVIDGIEQDGKVRVLLPWGQLVTVEPNEVTPWEEPFWEEMPP